MGDVQKIADATVDVIPVLKACPFCGSNAVAVVGSFVRCGNCGATGPFGATVEAAVENWNERGQAPGNGMTSAVGEEQRSPG